MFFQDVQGLHTENRIILCLSSLVGMTTLFMFGIHMNLDLLCLKIKRLELLYPFKSYSNFSYICYV